MKSPERKLALIIFLFSASIFNTEGRVLQRVRVSVLNQLGDGKSLGIHCHSKDDDLGFHNLANGTNVSWSFRVNLWGTTLFYCDVNWHGSARKRFTAFSNRRDGKRCRSDCDWMIKSDQRLYGRNPDSGSWDLVPYNN